MQGKIDRSKIEKDINILAWKDPAFKAKLMTNPNEALKEFGLHVPAHAKIYVHEEKADTWHLTIHQPPLNAKDLSDDELRKVSAAGGIKAEAYCFN